MAVVVVVMMMMDDFGGSGEKNHIISFSFIIVCINPNTSPEARRDPRITLFIGWRWM